MAIIIPSKTIYGKPVNNKVRNNYIDNVAVSITNVQPDNDYKAPVHNQHLSIDNIINGETKFKGSFYEQIIYHALLEVLAFVGISTKTIKGSVKIPKLTENKYISKVYDLTDNNNENQIKHTVNFVAFQAEVSANILITTYPTGTSKVHYEYTISDYQVISDYKQIEYIGDINSTLTNKQTAVNDFYPINKVTTTATIQAEDTTNLSNVKIDDSDPLYYSFDYEIYVGAEHLNLSYEDSFTGGNPNLPSPNPKPVKGTVTIFLPTSVEITVYGDTIGISLEEGTITYTGIKSLKNYPYSLDGNELMQKNAKLFNTELSKALATTVLSEYKNGKETATLLCQIGEYKTESGELAISTKEEGLPMTFREGDVVIPMVMSTDRQDVPMSKYNDGTKKKFEVVKVKYIDEGCVWQEITLQEYMR